MLLSVGQPAQPVLGDAELEQEPGEVRIAHGGVPRAVEHVQRVGNGVLHAVGTTARAVQSQTVVLERRHGARMRGLVAQQPVGPVSAGLVVAGGPPGPGDDAPGLGVLLEAGAGLPEEPVHAALVACEKSRAVLGQHGAGFVVLSQGEEAA